MTTSCKSNNDSKCDDLNLKPGYKVDGRWEIVKSLGEGAFGAVYEARDTQGHLEGTMALKIESVNAKVQLLKIEVAVCKALQGNQHVCTLFGCGKNNKFNFMLMSVLGPNLSQLRSQASGSRLSLSTTTRVTFHCLRAIRSVHEVGWLHRDIKPSNFAIGPTENTKSALYIFDFGLCREFNASKNVEMRPARPKAGFRGTLRYCSINAHRKLELGRHDDLISLMYMMVEMAKGSLPWSTMNETNAVYKTKIQNDQSIFTKLPPKLIKVHQYLHTLSYDDLPRYSEFEETLLEIIYTMGYHLKTLDWQNKDFGAKLKETNKSNRQHNKGIGNQPIEEAALKKLDDVIDPAEGVVDLPSSFYKEQ